MTVTANPRAAARVGTSMAIGSMFCVQLGLAASVGLMRDVGPVEVAWLRLCWAGLIFLAMGRPRRASFDRRSFGAALGLGLATAGVTLLFMSAANRLPIGTASALEFLGPLGVAVVRSHRSARIWAVAAAVGVVLLTHPWTGSTDALGITFALGSAICWAAYIVLTQQVGDSVSGVTGLAVSMPVAALVATLIAAPTDLTFTPTVIAASVGIAILMPIVPFTLELLALRRLNAGAFGTLMALEPAFALLIGFLILHQNPSGLAVLGIAFVVAAGIGAERSGARAEVDVAEVVFAH